MGLEEGGLQGPGRLALHLSARAPKEPCMGKGVLAMEWDLMKCSPVHRARTGASSNQSS